MLAKRKISDIDDLRLIGRREADLRKQVRLREMVEECMELLKRIDEIVAKSPLKPLGPPRPEWASHRPSAAVAGKLEIQSR